MKSVFKLIRSTNLVIVAITQYLLQYIVVVPYHQKLETLPVLDHFHFLLLVITTVLVAAGGYVINDLKDIEIDKINKPDGMILVKEISIKSGKIIYKTTVGLGVLIAVYLTWWIERPLWFLLFPMSVSLLWSYSTWFKKSFLIGNLIVAFFAAGVAGIILFPEVFNLYWRNINQEAVFLIGIFSGYVFFAFSSTMMREIIKDIEDMEGDKLQGATTLPIISGVAAAKFIAILWGLMLLFGFFFFLKTLFEQGQILPFIFGGLLVFLPIFYSIFKIYFSKVKKDFHQTSQILKMVMLAGLLFLILIIKVNF